MISKGFYDMKGQIIFSLSTMLEVIIVLSMLFGLIFAIGNISVTNLHDSQENVRKLSIVDSAHNFKDCIVGKSETAGKTTGIIDARDAVKFNADIDGCRKASGPSFVGMGIYSEKDKIEKLDSGNPSRTVDDHTIFSNVRTSSGIRQVKINVQK